MAERGGETLLAGSVIGFGALSTAFWGAGHSAAALAGGDLDARWPQAAVALVRNLFRPDDPEWAWRAEPDTFGSLGVYWFVAGCFLVATIVALVALWMWWSRFNVSLDRDVRLGVVPEARMGLKKELAPIRVPRPIAGRFTFGRVMGELVATEDQQSQTSKQIRNRAVNRVGDRTSVMIFGPTRSGKTNTIVPGIIEWDYPAVISSVKDDLMNQTIKRRLEIGTVYLFDPFKVARHVPDQVERVSWSPISCAMTTDGAIDAAQTLADAAASNDLTSGGFWSDRGMSVLWPLLFAAAHANKSMTDVLGWLTSHDAVEDKGDENTEAKRSEVLGILRSLETEGQALGQQARLARSVAEGWSELDPKQRSDQMATAQSLVSCWNNLHAAAASSSALPAIDIGKILAGRNTLYIVAPLGRGDQYAPLFGGLFGDLIRDQTYRVAHANGKRAGVGPLLAVLDEAANMPLRWLPEVASTCAGIGVQLVTVWQDRSQIDALYQEKAQSLLNNHATKVFFAGQTDKETLEYASMLCGEEDVTSNSASADLNIGSTRKSASAQIVSKRLVPTDMLRMIPNGTALLMHNTLRPFHMVGRRVSEEPTLTGYVLEEDLEDEPDMPLDLAGVGITGAPLGAPPAVPLRRRVRRLFATATGDGEPRELLGEYEPDNKMVEAFSAVRTSIDDDIVTYLQRSQIAVQTVDADVVVEVPERGPLGD